MATIESRPARADPRGPPGRRRAASAAGPVASALLAMLIVFAGAGAALAVSQVVEQRYGASAQVVYDVGDVASQPQADRLLATQIVVMGSRAVLGPVAEAHGLSPRRLSRQVEVELLQDSQVIELTVAAADRQAAVALAEDVVASYLSVSQVEVPARVSEQIERLSSGLEELGAERAQLEADLAGAAEEGTATEASVLTIELEAVTARMQAWQAELTALELRSVGGTDARVLTPPFALEEPLGPGPLQAVAAGTIGGIFVAAGTLLALRRWGRERV